MFKGSLALIRFGDALCHIWVMREYGVVESWTEQIAPLEMENVETSSAAPTMANL